MKAEKLAWGKLQHQRVWHRSMTPSKINIVYILIDDETFQQTFVNKTSKDSLKISIHANLDTWYTFLHSLYFIENQPFPRKVFYLKSWQECNETPGNPWVTIDHRISSTPERSLPASGSGLVILFVKLKLVKSLTVPCSNAPFFILLAFRYILWPIERKIHRKIGSHNDSKIYSAMLTLKQCTLSRGNAKNPYWCLNVDFWHRHVTVPIWIQSNGKYYRVLTASFCKVWKVCNKPCYNIDLDITRSYCGWQLFFTMEFFWIDGCVGLKPHWWLFKEWLCNCDKYQYLMNWLNYHFLVIFA